MKAHTSPTVSTNFFLAKSD